VGDPGKSREGSGELLAGETTLPREETGKVAPPAEYFFSFQLFFLAFLVSFSFWLSFLALILRSRSRCGQLRQA
jgi:hypothetical protein